MTPYSWRDYFEPIAEKRGIPKSMRNMMSGRKASDNYNYGSNRGNGNILSILDEQKLAWPNGLFEEIMTPNVRWADDFSERAVKLFMDYRDEKIAFSDFINQTDALNRKSKKHIIAKDLLR